MGSLATSRLRGDVLEYRADVDGLRAVAVLSVVGFHAGVIPGGFVGVDIFFVISGFLISGLILSGLRASSFSFLTFYGRRVRRLFPALIVLLLATWALGWFVMLPPEFAAVGEYMLAGVGFAANVLTYFQVGYFDGPASSKPLLHLWSLGVEEQFYIFYPAILVLAWRARLVWQTMALLGVASFIANIILTSAHLSLAFYLPMSRFWEFVAGALLALRPIRGLSPLGALLILAGVLLCRGDAFPGWWALLPVIGAALLIGDQAAWPNRRILAHPLLVFIGLISYPLYLWHWPLLVMAAPYVGKWGAVALSFILAWLTYRFVEQPARLNRLRRVVPLAATTAAFVAFLGFATARDGFLLRYPEEVQALMKPLVIPPPYAVPAEAQTGTGPMVVLYGDSFAGHLVAGLLDLQRQRPFRLALVKWNRQREGEPDCPPGGLRGHQKSAADEEWCRNLTAANEKTITDLKPDIVVLGGFWPQHDHVERLEDTLRFLHRIGVGTTVIMGTTPFWPKTPQALMYEAYAADGRAPDRLVGFDEEAQATNRRLKELAEKFGATFISAHDVLCNGSGCLSRLGSDIVQLDRVGHFTDAGSRFFVRAVEGVLFGSGN